MALQTANKERSVSVFIYLFGILRRFQHCTGHIMMGSWKGRGFCLYSSLGFCTVNCRPTASNYQLSHLRLCWESNPGLRGGGESVTTLIPWPLTSFCIATQLISPNKLESYKIQPFFTCDCLKTPQLVY